jgi:hypothetical protein
MTEFFNVLLACFYHVGDEQCKEDKEYQQGDDRIDVYARNAF